MAIKRLADATATQQQMAELVEHNESALLVFFGSEDPGTGESWCKDCVTADPMIRSACVERLPATTLFECPVGERNEWKDNATHPYKTDAGTRLERIPTLIAIREGQEWGRLVEADCSDQAALDAFLAGFAKDIGTTA